MVQTFQDYTNLHCKTLHVSVRNTDSNLLMFALVMDTSQLYPIAYVDSIFSACTHQRSDRFHACHGMLLSGLACQRWCQLPLHPTLINRNWPKLATGTTKSWCRLVEMSSRAKAFTNGPNFKDSVHKDNWHIASYCCFIQTEPTLCGTYIKNEVPKMLCWQKAVGRFAFQRKLAESATPDPFGTFALTPRYTACTRAPSQAPNQGCHANDWDAHQWNFEAAKLGGIHFGAVWEGINFGEPVLGT